MRTSLLFLAEATLALASGSKPHTVDQPTDPSRLAIKGRHPQNKRAQCNADNCARAVTGTRLGAVARASQSADCSSFLAVTIVPATSTSTVTVTPALVVTSSTILTTVVQTIYTTVTSASTTVDVESYADKKAKRSTGGAATFSASSVPAYATPCSGTIRYSSACSCFGVTASTSTAPTPVTTVTVTAPTSTTIVDVFSTISSSVTATTTATVVTDYIPCGQTIRGPYDGYRINVQCEAQPSSPGTVLTSNTVADWDACVYLADSTSASTSFEYTISTKLCTLYRDPSGAFASSPAAGMVFGSFPQ